MKSYNFFTIKALLFLLAFLVVTPAFSQQPDNQKKQPTKDEILNMTYEQLLNMPFQDLINLASIVGVSADELLQMILNKDVSSASKKSEKVLQSPLSTTVISKEEIAASGVLSIPEALRLVPGMIVREKTPGNFDIHIRGNDNIPPKSMYLYTEDAMSLVMIDNRPVYNYSFGGTFWETLPIGISDVERIEVIRGASSSLYGPNAVAGVINIITKRSESNKLAASGNVQLGSNNSRLADIGVSGGVGNKFKFRVSGNYQYQERFENDFYVFDLNKSVSYNDMLSLKQYWTAAPQDTSRAEVFFKDEIPNKHSSMDKFGINAFLYYDLDEHVNFSLTTGVQNSTRVSTTLGNHTIPLIGRISNTKYLDFHSKFYGFDFQTNYLWGDQQVEAGNPAWHIDPKILNSQLEYEYKVGTLSLRPGVSYQSTIYSDAKYVDISKKSGFLNGDRKLSSMAGFIRADYKPIDKLRLIAALRADKYDIPAKTYLTYQFATTYNIDDKNLIRGVYSRANRGPFIVDSHADYSWEVVPGYQTLHWSGNQNLKLPVMDMVELGYRTQLGKHIMIDIEAFRTVTKDYSYFIPDSMALTANFAPMLLGKAPQYSLNGNINYHNFDLTTIQRGITINFSVAVSKQLNFRLFGTLQESKINNFYNKTIWDNFNAMGLQNGIAFQTQALTYQAQLTNANPAIRGAAAAAITANPILTYRAVNNVNDADKVDTYNKSTPTLYGGASLDYSPTGKINLFASMYYYTAQTIETNKVDMSNSLGASNMYMVDPKVTVNFKVSFKIWKENSIYLNARNFFNNSRKEFAYTDQIGGTYLAGINFNF